MKSLFVKNTKKFLLLTWVASWLFAFAACGADAQDPREGDGTKAQATSDLTLQIDGIAVDVLWEDNESVDALTELAKEESLTIKMSKYGGFEQVGSLGTGLPRNDQQTTTFAGDIVLYSGNQIVVFYGSNSWAYTRLGKIQGKTAEELASMLGGKDVTLTLRGK